MMDEPIGNPLEDFLHTLTAYGLENTASRRYYSKYPGKVVSNDDPSQEGRVKIVVGVTGDDKPLTLWAAPSAAFAGNNYGAYFPPEVGDMVWVWFDHGKPTQPHYSGGWWINPSRIKDGDSNVSTSYVPAEFKDSGGGSPTVRGIKTKKGHALLFDDATSDPKVELWTGVNNANAAATRNHQIVMSDKPGEQKVTIKSSTDQQVVFDTVAKTITISTPGGHSVVLNDTAGSVNVTSTGTVTVDAAGLVTINAAGGVTTNATGGHFVKAIAGNDTNTVQGNQINTVVGNLTESLTGNGTQTYSGAMTRTYSGAVTEGYTGALSQTVAGAHTVAVTGASTTTVAGLYALTTIGAAALTFGGVAALLTTGALTLGGAGTTAILATIASATAGGVILGAVTGASIYKRLVTEDIMAIFNTHTHTYVPNNTSVPTPTTVPGVLVATANLTSVVKAN